LAAGLVATLVGLAGCYGPVIPTINEPGEYKGATDPLLKKLATPESKKALQERFTMGQTDR
jgi:hypothetical protein